MQLTNRPIRLKSVEEIIKKAREVISRHRSKYLKRGLRECPENCTFADVVGGHRVTGCQKCGSHNPEQCKKPELFVPLNSKQELYKEFQSMLRDPEVLWREYRDIFVFYWVLGVFDPIKEGTLDEQVIQKIEKKSEQNK
jgi:hypothetical protein